MANAVLAVAFVGACAVGAVAVSQPAAAQNLWTAGMFPQEHPQFAVARLASTSEVHQPDIPPRVITARCLCRFAVYVDIVLASLKQRNYASRSAGDSRVALVPPFDNYIRLLCARPLFPQPCLASP